MLNIVNVQAAAEGKENKQTRRRLLKCLAKAPQPAPRHPELRYFCPQRWPPPSFLSPEPCVAENTHTRTLCLFTHDHPVTPVAWQDAYLGAQLWARGAISSDLLCSLRTF